MSWRSYQRLKPVLRMPSARSTISYSPAHGFRAGGDSASAQVGPPRERSKGAEHPDTGESEPPGSKAAVAARKIEHRTEHQRREKRGAESRKRVDRHRGAAFIRMCRSNGAGSKRCGIAQHQAVVHAHEQEHE